VCARAWGTSRLPTCCCAPSRSAAAWAPRSKRRCTPGGAAAARRWHWPGRSPHCAHPARPPALTCRPAIRCWGGGQKGSGMGEGQPIIHPARPRPRLAGLPPTSHGEVKALLTRGLLVACKHSSLSCTKRASAWLPQPLSCAWATLPRLAATPPPAAAGWPAQARCGRCCWPCCASRPPPPAAASPAACCCRCRCCCRCCCCCLRSGSAGGWASHTSPAQTRCAHSCSAARRTARHPPCARGRGLF